MKVSEFFHPVFQSSRIPAGTKFRSPAGLTYMLTVAHRDAVIKPKEMIWALVDLHSGESWHVAVLIPFSECVSEGRRFVLDEENFKVISGVLYPDLEII
jgi:hypothetical protein